MVMEQSIKLPCKLHHAFISSLPDCHSTRKVIIAGSCLLLDLPDTYSLGKNISRWNSFLSGLLQLRGISCYQSSIEA